MSFLLFRIKNIKSVFLILLNKIVAFGLASVALFLLVVRIMRCCCICSSRYICTVFSCFAFFYWFFRVVAIPFKKLLHTFFS